MPDTALIITDVLSAYDHPDADALAESAASAVPRIAELIERAGEEETQVIWVNDNFDRWEAGRSHLVETALAGRHPELVEPIVPPEDVPFLSKGRHSAFYQTPLEHLLRVREIRRLVLAGQVTEQCILYTALDAKLRGFEIVVPRDAVAHIDPHLADAALAMIERNMGGEVLPSVDCDLVGRATARA